MNAHNGDKNVSVLDNCISSEIQSNISTKEIEFGSIRILDVSNNVVTHVQSEDDIIISFSFRSLRYIEDPIFGILIRNRYGMSIFGTNTYLLQQKNNPIIPGKFYSVFYRMKISLQPDDYLITIAIDNKGKATNSFDEYLLRLNDIATLKVIPNDSLPIYDGVTNLHLSIEVNSSIIMTS
jgi:lipopolysaccharide transport system ATP-binding protein